LTQASEGSNEIFTVMGAPVAYNDTDKVWYQESGKLLSDAPSVNELESVIRVNTSNGTVLLNDIIVMNGRVICFCVIPSTNTYFFRQFSLSDLSVSVALTTSVAFGTSSDFSPYIYADSGFIYITNDMNTSADNFSISKFSYNPTAASLTFVSSVDLDSSFEKTTNAVIRSGLLYTMVSGILNTFNLTTGIKASIGNYSGVVGQIFKLNGQVYFTSGQVGKKWF
jgi:hypothetical protein